MGLLKSKIHQLETSEEGRFGIGQDSWGEGGTWMELRHQNSLPHPQDMAGQGTLRWGAQTATHPHLQGCGEASVLSLAQRSIHKAASLAT